MNLREERVLVTGGAGFLGRHVVQRLRELGIPEDELIVPRSTQYDLTQEREVMRLFLSTYPTVCIHLAAVVGGIGANQKRPGDFFRENMLLGMNVLEQCRQHGIKKLVMVGTVCSYPKHCPVPFREDSLWNGYPEETNAPYGIAKKALFVMADAYRKQYGIQFIALIPVNLYGPGDNFSEDTSHVIPALIRRFMRHKLRELPEIPVWGTGKATREFLYVEDAARGIVQATEVYNGTEPVNLGSGWDISIEDLAYKLARIIEYKGKIVFDPSKPDGQPTRKLDVSRAEAFGFRATTDFSQGLRKTVEWWLAQPESSRP